MNIQYKMIFLHCIGNGLYTEIFHVKIQLLLFYTPFTLSKNYLDYNLDRILDCNLDNDPEDVPYLFTQDIHCSI